MTAPLGPGVAALRAPQSPPDGSAGGWFGPQNPPVRDWSTRQVWIIGASSGIGEALAQRLIALGARVALSGRNAEALARVAGSRAEAVVLPLDVTRAESVADATTALLARWDRIDLVIWMAGTYRPMQADGFDLDAARQIVASNLMGPLNGLAALLPVLLRQRSGAIALVGSVAGYSGLPKALIYGPTKAALINLAESLYLDLRPHGIGVHIVNPGFVETRLTAANDFDMPALLSPDEAAKALIAGLEKGRFEIHFPRRFTLWLKFARCLPYRLYFLLTGRLTAGRKDAPHA